MSIIYKFYTGPLVDITARVAKLNTKLSIDLD